MMGDNTRITLSPSLFTLEKQSTENLAKYFIKIININIF